MTNPNCEYGANFIAIHTLAQWSKCSVDGTLPTASSDTVSCKKHIRNNISKMVMKLGKMQALHDVIFVIIKVYLTIFFHSFVFELLHLSVSTYLEFQILFLPHSALEMWMVGKKFVSHVYQIPIFLHCPRVKMSLKQKFFS